MRSTTLKGNPFALIGPELKPGDHAPDALVKANLLEMKSILTMTAGKTRIFSVVPSVDTPVCELQTVRFAEEATKLPQVAVVTVSVDLPVATGRFCKSKNIDVANLHFVSDHRDLAFGKAYGTLVPDLGIECRALFVVGADGVIKFAQYVPEIAEHPNYEGALAAARG